MSQHAAPLPLNPSGVTTVAPSAQAHRRSEPAVIVQRLCRSPRVHPPGPLCAAAGRPWQKDLVVDPFIFDVI
jgi:hypothetical protein